MAQSWFQGIILNSRHTRIITESMALYLASLLMILFAGVAWGGAPGLYVAMTGLMISSVIQVGWLALRSRPEVRHLWTRDAATAHELADGYHPAHQWVSGRLE